MVVDEIPMARDAPEYVSHRTAGTEILYVCPISYFHWKEGRRKTIDTYFDSTWREEHPWFDWEANVHFFVKPDNYCSVSVEESSRIESLVLDYNKEHYRR